MAVMTDKVQPRLGDVQQTLFIPLAGRARESGKKRPVLRDPKAAEIVKSVDFDTDKYGRDWGGAVTVLRTAIFDWWVRAFLAWHPAGIEIGVLVADRATHGRQPMTVGTALHRRLVKAALFALARVVAGRMAVHAARIRQHFSELDEHCR